MKRKMKRFAEGDEVVDMRSDTSQPTGIDDDVRSRAMRFLETGKKDEEMSSSKPKTIVRRTTKTVVKEPSKKSGEEPKNFRVPEEPGLENVSPELDLLPIGKAAGVLGAGYLGAKALGKRILGKRAAEAAYKEEQLAKQQAAESRYQTPQTLQAPQDGALSDRAIAANMLAQAQRMEAEGKGLLAEAARMKKDAERMSPNVVASTTVTTADKPKRGRPAKSKVADAAQ